MIHRIYPPELQLNKANASDTEAAVLDLNISIHNDTVSTKSIAQTGRVINCFKRARYTLNIMRQTACLVFNPIMIECYAGLFSCTAVVQASDSMTASM